ncbi:DUF2530 domain-containing protein [Cellulomonas wangsupingiae]|uniref:DUF2530 domain-containing protein n=1 Tax=Cellulomonas wangsupingiae TaxID=2968085 RepID=A0ABY5KAC5_9CELL|nr:DUF2530 domain-containing protein [Cellulomonas wangsupingiae]MCC2334223.1 DUF2530 domain-containing protein [Cellulomonas wangsupingiae]UUI65901.1 DUF2530 domain-containing protein [Cellulomonas wangsupingiae]
MPSVVHTLMHPHRTPPPPIDVDLARVMGSGTTLWGAALVVTGVLSWLGVAPATWVWVCGAGVALGVVGVLWARHNGRLSSDGTGAMIRPGDEDPGAPTILG